MPAPTPMPVPRVTLTTFVKFLVAPSNKRLRVVREAKEQYSQEYETFKDYWKELRDRIVEMHKKGEAPQVLDRFLASMKSGRKDENYAKCVAAYKKWLGRKDATWIGTNSFDWQTPGLVVSVNPELGLDLKGSRHAIKLYFGSEKLSLYRVQTTLGLLSLAKPSPADSRIPAILDVRNGKLHIGTPNTDGIAEILEVEAIAFREFWNRL